MDDNRRVTIMIGTNPYACACMLRGEYNLLVWASASLETVAHYFEGAVVELTVQLDNSLRSEYVRGANELRELPNADSYGWGVAEVRYPDGASWYSFSREYLKTHVVSIQEIHPDLTPWMECNED